MQTRTKMSSCQLSQERLRFLTRAPGGKIQVIELNARINGYDAGFEKDEFDCNLDTCECANFNQYVIGNNPIDW